AGTGARRTRAARSAPLPWPVRQPATGLAAPALARVFAAQARGAEGGGPRLRPRADRRALLRREAARRAARGRYLLVQRRRSGSRGAGRVRLGVEAAGGRGPGGEGEEEGSAKKPTRAPPPPPVSWAVGGAGLA